MDEPRSLGQRRVTLAFQSERMAEELLALAYQWLRPTVESRKPDPDSVQGPSTRKVDNSVLQEVTP